MRALVKRAYAGWMRSCRAEATKLHVPGGMSAAIATTLVPGLAGDSDDTTAIRQQKSNPGN